MLQGDDAKVLLPAWKAALAPPINGDGKFVRESLGILFASIRR